MPNREVLQNTCSPRNYELFLAPDLDSLKYEGRVQIDLEITKPTNQVSLNILDLQIKAAKLNDTGYSDSEENQQLQSITWTFPNTVNPGEQAVLDVEFSGVLNDKMCGFYRSIYKDDDGTDKVMATTQMEATDCRRAFPCFDEPEYKATFNISIKADKKFTVLSNADVNNVVDLGDSQITHFNATPKMSTYLVAFIVAELKYVESNLFRVPVKVYATPGLETRCQYAADLAARTLEFFEQTFGVEYPLPKCDMVGIHDFSAGAMENWGLITYRLVEIFYEPGKDSDATKTRVTEVIQHELAHQWFGNLVTMKWWDGLWLNEGFATWMSWYASNHFYPEWKVWETYINQAYSGCLSLDGLRSSHPIQVPINSADDVAEIFDAISYLKGSCVIRMVSQFLGEDVFIKGISLYLKRHQYQNTETDDLWAALSEASGKDVKSFMDPWVLEQGYPVLSVSEPKDGKVTITQNRYLSTGDVTNEDDKVLYPVWLGVRDGEGNVDRSEVLTDRKCELKAPSFFKLNADQNGIFRVSYSESTLEKLAAEGAKGANSALSVEDRIGILSDLIALLGTDQVRGSQVLSLINQWKNESEPNVIDSILDAMSIIEGKLMFESDELRSKYRHFVQSIVVPLADKLGHDFSSGDVRLSKAKAGLFSEAISTKSEKYIIIAIKEYAEKQFDVEPNLRGSIYKANVLYGTQNQWDELFNHYLEGTNGISGTAALVACGRAERLDNKQRILDCILDQTIRPQDAINALSGIASNAPGALLGWQWMQENWDQLRVIFPTSISLMGYLVKIIVAQFTKQSQLDEANEFFKDKDLKGVSMALDQAKEKAHVNIIFLEKYKQDIENWLKENNYS